MCPLVNGALVNIKVHILNCPTSILHICSHFNLSNNFLKLYVKIPTNITSNQVANRFKMFKNLAFLSVKVKDNKDGGLIELWRVHVLGIELPPFHASEGDVGPSL